MRTLLSVAMLSLPVLAAAQQPATVRLQPHDARLETGFTSISSIRELSDGRILVTDPRDLQLVVADFRTGEVKPVSRRGAGPGEYGMAGMVYAIGGDSSLMPDFMQRRVLLFDADKAVATVAADNAMIKATQGFVRYDGRWTRGAPLPIPVIRMTEKEKDASRARTAASLAASRGSGPPPPPMPKELQTPDDEWPDVLPPLHRSVVPHAKR